MEVSRYGIRPFYQRIRTSRNGYALRINDGTELYVTGKSHCKDGVVIIPNLLDWQSEPVINLCDFLGEQGCLSVIPNFASNVFRSREEYQQIPEIVAESWTNYGAIEVNLTRVLSSVLIYLRAKSVENIALIGIGWGSWVVVNILSSNYLKNDFQCAVVSTLDAEEYGNSVANCISQVSCPLLVVIEEKQDRDYYRPYLRLLKAKFPTSKIVDDDQLRQQTTWLGIPKAEKEVKREEEENEYCDPHILETILNEWKMMLSFIHQHFEMKGQDITHHYGDSIEWEEYFQETMKSDEQEDQEQQEERAKDKVDNKGETVAPVLASEEDNWDQFEKQQKHHPSTTFSMLGAPSTKSLPTKRRDEGILATEMPAIDYDIPYGAYYPLGVEIELTDGTEIYVSRKPTAKEAILLLPEITTWYSSRIRNLSDFFGDQNYFTIVPNIATTVSEGSSGEEQETMAWYKSESVKETIRPILLSIVSYLHNEGIQKIGLLGIGRGSWLVVNIMTSPLAEEFQCGVIANPKLELEESIRDMKPRNAAIKELMKAINRPILIVVTEGKLSDYEEYLKLIKQRMPSSRLFNLLELNQDFLLCLQSDQLIVRDRLNQCLQQISTFFQEHFTVGIPALFVPEFRRSLSIVDKAQTPGSVTARDALSDGVLHMRNRLRETGERIEKCMKMREKYQRLETQKQALKQQLQQYDWRESTTGKWK